MPRATTAPVPPPVLEPYWTTTDGQHVRLYHGNVTEVLARLPAKSVHICVTSPPYWGLRDYGTATYEGGNSDCKHKMEKVGTVQYLDRTGKPGSNNTRWQGAKGHATVQLGETCTLCGALRIEDNQLGSEPSPDCKTDGQAQCGRCHVCNIVAVFRGVYRVLRDDGVIFVNYGDSYASGGKSDTRNDWDAKVGDDGSYARRRTQNSGGLNVSSGIPSGNLVGIPWRVALALQTDGWVLRQDIIWHKPAPMPESVRNRCTKAHEYVFLLAKSAKYFYDAEAIKEKTSDRSKGQRTTKGYDTADRYGANNGGNGGLDGMADRLNSGAVTSSNKRSVWTVSSQLLKLRDDLTDEQKSYVLRKLVERGLL